jgi:hypothetical protein
MANLLPNQCTVFIQVWVDVNGLTQGQTTGCYAVSNRSQNSSGEGTANLETKVVTGSNVCWSIVPVDPQYNGEFTITNIGVASGWNRPPSPPLPAQPNVFTGQLTTATVGGSVNSNVSFSYNGGLAITVTLPVTITPVAS